MSWHWLDYLIVAVIALSVITGLFRGFIKELIALCVWILAIWLAFSYSSLVESWLSPYIQDKTARTIAAFIAILLATLIVGGVINAMLGFLLKQSGLSGTDRLLGMGFGFVRGAFIVGLLLLMLQMTSIPHQDFTSQSRLYATFLPLVNWLHGYVPALVKQVDVWDKGVKKTKDTKPAA